MCNNIELSIIIPIYNVEKHLESCIESLLNKSQYKNNFEVLLIDDGSTDGSSVICDKLKKKYRQIKAFHKENGGAADSRNFGLEKAKGKFITFIDSDDIVNKEYISSIFYLIDKGYDLVIFGHQIDYLENKYNKIHEIKITDEVYVANVKETLRILEKKGSFNLLWNKIYRRQLLESPSKIRFLKNSEPGEDLIFNCSYFKRIDTCLLSPNILYHWIRRGEDTLANKFQKDLFIKNKMFISEREKLYTELGMNDQEDLLRLYSGNMDYIFVCIPNMYRGGDKTFKLNKRLTFYEEIINSKKIEIWLSEIQIKNKLLKLFYFLYKLHIPVIMDMTFYILMYIRRNIGGFWSKVRSVFVHEKSNN